MALGFGGLGRFSFNKKESWRAFQALFFAGRATAAIVEGLKPDACFLLATNYTNFK